MGATRNVKQELENVCNVLATQNAPDQLQSVSMMEVELAWLVMQIQTVPLIPMLNVLRAILVSPAPLQHTVHPI